jgi:pyruvate/2-oxoglutarate dehydrogenase complex dihydrolipoamide acyltransferase (E2) component
MADVVFPAMSQADPQAQGVVSTWFVVDGEAVAANQLIGEVAVDKVSEDVAAPAAGTVRLLVDEGAVVVQGTVIARVE